MSEAIRSYRPPRGASYGGPSRPRGFIRSIVLTLIVLAFVWLVWTTRDNYPVERVIPQNQSFHFQVPDLLTTRLEVAQSAIWTTGLVPAQYEAIPEWIGTSFGYPDWVLNNLVSDACYVSGTDLTGFSDLLVVTRMSRVGCLLERYHRFIDEIEDEFAGGLRLRKLKGVDFYYAVRGRTLVFSPSRDAIVRALTLREEDALASLETAGMDGSEDLRGRIVFAEEDGAGQYVERLDCRLDVTAESIVFRSESRLKSAWRGPLDSLRLGDPDLSLSVPQSGGLLFTGSFGVPLAQVWNTMDGMAGGVMTESVRGWGMLDQLSPEGRSLLDPVLGEVAQNLGSGFMVRADGVDLEGILPLPMVQLTFQPTTAGQQLLSEVPVTLAPDALPLEGIPYRRADGSLVRFPLGWGDRVEPSVIQRDNRAHLVLHPAHATQLEAGEGPVGTLEGAGHLYVRLRPSELLSSFHDGLLLYAAEGLLPGHTAESLEALLLAAQGASEQISEVNTKLSYDDGLLSVALRLDLGAPVPTE